MLKLLMPILLVIANILGWVMIIPQLRKLYKSGSTEGLSAQWMGVALAMNLGWISYGAALGLWGIVPVSVIALFLYGLMAVHFCRIDRGSSLFLLAAGFFVPFLLVLAALTFTDWKGVGLFLGFGYAVQFAPATWSAVSSPRPEGVSMLTWCFALAEGIIWFLYGMSQNDTALVIGGGGGMLMSAVIVLRMLFFFSGKRKVRTV